MDRLKKKLRQARQHVIRWWRLNAVVPRLLRYNPYTGFIGRRVFQYLPFVLPHDKSYYGFRHLVHDGDGLFLDVGANDGISAIGFAHIHSDYRILSIEPNLCHAHALRVVKRRLKRFEYKLLGAGSGKAEMTLYIPVYNGVPIYTAASLNKEYTWRTMSEQHLPGDRNKDIVILEHKVDIVPLDDLDLKPDIIKIDTEGFDYEALLGLAKTIDLCRPAVMIEHSPDLMDKLETYFSARDYVLLSYDHVRDQFHAFDRDLEGRLFRDRQLTTNIFCIPIERVGSLPRASQKAN